MNLIKHNPMRRLAAGLLAAALSVSLAVPALAANPTHQLTSPVALLMEVDSRQIIYQKNMDQTMYPASTTKIMTALLAFENADLDETITMSYEATHTIDYGSSHIALDTDEQISMENALYALMLPSANDAANGIAEHVGGTMEEFAVLMNKRAEELGCTNTNFVNAHGLHDSEHHTTAHDLALIAAEAVRFEDFCKIWGTVQHDVPPTNQNVLRNLRTQVRMLNKDGNFYYQPCTGGKLGWTPEAKNTCVLVAKKNGMELMCVLMGVNTAREMFNDAEYLFEYGFEHLQPYQVENEETQTQTITGYNSAGEEIGEMTLGFNALCLMDSGAKPQNITVDWTLPAQPILGSASGIYVTLSMEDAGNSGQYTELGTYPAAVLSQQLYGEEAPAPVAKPDTTPDRPGFLGVLLAILKWLLIAAGVLVGGFALLYLVVRIRYEYRKAKRRKLRREMAARGIYPKRKTTAASSAARSKGRKQ
ncbi:MAG: D-alanyl-D-alanine carboxypeptidase [Oscillospiraceae bacterium]|nr:D-alanyl-D-alanine carboxypeptidase [Oscillospiraceae bacterium]